MFRIVEFIKIFIKKEENKTMKFVKGMLLGSAISVGMMVMYSEGMFNKKKMKQMVKKINL